MKIDRGSFLYTYLSAAFNGLAKLSAGNPDSSEWRFWHSYKGLEKSDFCRIMRVGLLQYPLILFVQFVILPVFMFFMLVRPFLIAFNPLAPLIVPLGAVGFLVIVGVICLILKLIGMLLNKIFDPFAQKIQTKEPSQVGTFIKESYQSIKHQFCPLVTFDGEETHD